MDWVHITPKLVTTRRSTLGPPAEGRPGPREDDSDDDDDYCEDKDADEDEVDGDGDDGRLWDPSARTRPFPS